jgi:hypothetical protein
MATDSICNYCGEWGGTRDHVVPHSYASRSGVRDFSESLVVPCCLECNSLLGNRLFPSIEARGRWIGKSLRRRYKKLLSAPVWTVDELSELGPSLRQSIMADAKRRSVVRNRILWAERL